MSDLDIEEILKSKFKQLQIIALEGQKNFIRKVQKMSEKDNVLKIKVGEYVRTEIGTIGKVKSISYAGSGTRYYGEELTRNYYTIAYNDDSYGRFDDDGITKHSFNIIDLIEAGDVINYYSNYSGNEIKMEVDYVCCKKDDYKWGMGYVSTHYDDYVYIEDIKSIVTKEMMESIEYKIGG